ncbi:MAG: carboxymuconolactone decarboxylase family protein [Coxiellaceae bacterium]|nr:carboxymuconolactone decarboxylase family protein [Coxiellaceae bacterium]
MTDAIYDKGLKLLNKLHGGQAGEQMVAELFELSPELVDMTIRWAFGEVHSRPGIDLKIRELVTIASCITDGAIQPQLRAHYEAALKIGVTQQQIVEVILQMIFYAGMAKASNALRLLKEVVS